MKLPVLESNPQIIKQIKFGVFSQQQIKQLSVLELHQRDLFDVSGTERKAATGGVLDGKLV